ncbi:hypothetical protein [Anaeromyxobacter diazotrophicus]|nr:hypothetical protein [Anaeromyxobacter diazotrophicus]
MRYTLSPAVAGALLALAACAGGVKTVRTSDAQLAPRPSDCPLEFLQKAPERPYDELAELETHVTAAPAGGTREALRPKACELGADAVIVTRDFVTNAYGHAIVAGTAIKYRAEAPPAPEAPAPEAPAPEAPRPGAPVNL